MTRDQVRTAVAQALCAVAPEADPSTLMPDVPLREQLDIDSMDALRFMVEIKRLVGVDVPERDYTRLVSLDSTTAYLVDRLGAAGGD